MKVRAAAALSVLAMFTMASVAMGGDPPQTSGTLKVYVQKGRSAAEEQFATEMIPWIASEARAQGLDLKVIDATKGAPEGIGATPDIAYQRLMFDGNVWDREEVSSFITSLGGNMWGGPHERHSIAWMDGLLLVHLGVRVHPLHGTPPEALADDAFTTEVLTSMNSAIPKYDGTRGAGRISPVLDMYFDATPDGTFAAIPRISSKQISTERLYARSTNDIIVRGRWEDRASIIADATKRAVEVFNSALRETERGGGLLPVTAPSNLPERAACGPAIPKPPAAWKLDTTSDKNSLRFRFPTPAADYAGVFKKFDVKLVQPDRERLKDMSFTVEVQTATATTRDPALDDTVAYSLESETRPVATFRLTSEENIYVPPGGGHPILVGLTGELDFLGRKTPLFVRAKVVRLFEGKRESLRLEAEFHLRLKQFKILGPEVEWPANDIVFMYAQFHLVPDSETKP